MARYGRYKKYSRRNKRLSSTNIFANRSAKSQAYQIAKLNKRVSTISRINRPEILTKFNNFGNVFTNSALSSNFFYTTLSPWTGSYTGDDEADDNGDITGNFNRCKNITARMVFEYSDDYNATNPDVTHQRTAGYRILVVQRKTPRYINDTYNIQLADVFNATSSQSSADTNLTIPLVAGIKSQFKILYSKSFTISDKHPIRYHKLNFNKCLNFTKDLNLTTTTTYPKGTVHIFILTGGLHADLNFNSQITVNGTLQIAYNDA